MKNNDIFLLLYLHGILQLVDRRSSRCLATARGLRRRRGFRTKRKMQVSLLLNVNINPQNVILTYAGFMVTANRCSSPWKITKMFPNNSSKINMSDNNILESNRLEGLSLKQPITEWAQGHEGDVIVTLCACYIRKPLYDLIGKAGKGRI